MQSNAIFAVIESIAATSKKKEKQALIAAHGADPEFRRVLVAALDPRVTYGLEIVPNYEPAGDPEEFMEGTWTMLSRLASRELRGNAARDAVQAELNAMSDASAELLRRIITTDLRAGFGASTVNKAIPGLIAEYPYMRCALPKEAKLDEFDWELGVFSEEKADGMFANVNKDADARVSATTRQGANIPLDKLPELAAAFASSLRAGTQTHGEMLVERDGKVLPRQESNGVMNHIASGGAPAPNERVIFKAWDQIPLAAVVTKGRYSVGYAERYAQLVSGLSGAGSAGNSPISVIETRVVHSLSEAYAHYHELLRQGKEGSVVKDPAGEWMDGTSPYQVKLKLEVDCDLLVTGWKPGKGKYAHLFGSLVGQTSDGLLEAAVSGFKDKDRKAIFEKLDQIVGSAVMTVRANSVTEPTEDSPLHSLFHPRIVEIRDPSDKSSADSLERVLAQFESAAQPA